jgi:hypothetical protein
VTDCSQRVGERSPDTAFGTIYATPNPQERKANWAVRDRIVIVVELVAPALGPLCRKAIRRGGPAV